MLSGQRAKSAMSGQFGFAAAKRFFIEFGGGEVIADAVQVLKPIDSSPRDGLRMPNVPPWSSFPSSRFASR